MSRAITSPELALLRSDGQWVELFIAAEDPLPVYTARINQTFTSYDGISEIAYDDGVGTLADVLPGMTMLIGSSAGAEDKGMVRIRKAPDGTKFYIGETSEIVFANDDYITVIDEFGLWPKHLTSEGAGVYKIDTDVAYSDQHANYDPVPVLGPDAVLWLPTDGTAALQPTAAGSWVLGGATITGYAWEAPGALSITGDTTATPTITYDTDGFYYIRCTVTASNGKSFLGQRRVYVFTEDPALGLQPIQVFQLNACEGSFEEGGWSFTVTMYAEATGGYIRDRAKVILFSKDHYGSTQASIGPVTGYENIVASGWVEGESVEWSPEGTVKFTVRGPQYWLQQMPTFPITVTNSTGAADTWLKFQNLTVDKYLFHILHWHSTATMLTDCYLSADTRLVPSLEAPAGVWDQLQVADKKILARPLCDRYGALYVQIDPQYTPVASRSGIPVVMTLLKNDWQGSVDIERRTVPAAGILDFSGTFFDGAASTRLFSRAPGQLFKRFGRVESRDQSALTGQPQANSLAGLVLGKINNPFPRLAFRLASNNRMVDIAPVQYCQVDIAAEDTLRGFICTAKKLIPRVVTYEHDPDTGALMTSVDYEGETFPENAVTVTYAEIGNTNPPSQPPGIPPIPIIPPITITPPGPGGPPPGDTGACITDMNAGPTGPYNLGGLVGIIDSRTNPYNNPPLWGELFAHFGPCTIRSGSAVNKTYIALNACWGTYEGLGVWANDLANDNWDIDAMDANGGNVLASATLSAAAAGCEWRTGTFSPGGPISIPQYGGFRVKIDPSIYGTVGFGVTGTVDSGALTVTDENGTTVSGLTVGNWYAIGVAGGPYYFHTPPVPSNEVEYYFAVSNNGGSSWSNSMGNGTQFGVLTGKPAWAETVELYTSHLSRLYFKATTTSIKIRAGDNAGEFSDNSGAINWTLWSAAIDIRRIAITQALIYNIC